MRGFSFPTGTDGDGVYTSGPASAYICSPTYHHGLCGEVLIFLYLLNSDLIGHEILINFIL